MSRLHPLIALSAAALLAVPFAASAATPAKADEHSAHQPAGAAAAPAAMPAQDDRMKAMREMRDKMAAATTPAERQALMADHMKAMQDGMQMMKGMSGMDGMGGMGGMAGMTDQGGKPTTGPKSSAKGMPADMTQHHQMMERRMDMMQTMMEMSMQRMPAGAAADK